MRVFLDTNVLVSAVATRGLSADLVYTVLAEHQLVLSETILSELRRVLRSKLRVPEELIDELEAFLRQEATLVVDEVAQLDIEIRDPTDAAVLAEAVAGEAEVLVTGDADLLEIVSSAPIPIHGPRDFWEQLRRRSEST